MTELVPRAPGGEPARPDPRFIGRGFYWPMTVDHTGGIRLTEGPDDIERSIRLILVTAPGERVMRPQFGCRIWELLFEPVSPNLLGQIAHAVDLALAQWEPRIEVEEVDPQPDPDDPSLVRIGITFRTRTTNDRRNLVYPFYVIPHEPE